MYELFFHKLNEMVDLTTREEDIVRAHLMPKKLRKKQYLLQEGDVCKFIAFTERGALRLYSADEKGSDHILQFAVEGWTISDLYSFLTGEPSIYNIDALEDCELALISRRSHDELLEKLPKYERYVRLQVTGAYIAMQRRLTSISRHSLQERYAAFMVAYPHIAQRVPQHMIASYLGLSPETLSRVRKKLTRE